MLNDEEETHQLSVDHQASGGGPARGHPHRTEEVVGEALSHEGLVVVHGMELDFFETMERQVFVSPVHLDLHRKLRAGLRTPGIEAAILSAAHPGADAPFVAQPDIKISLPFVTKRRGDIDFRDRVVVEKGHVLFRHRKLKRMHLIALEQKCRIVIGFCDDWRQGFCGFGLFAACRR